MNTFILAPAEKIGKYHQVSAHIIELITQLAQNILIKHIKLGRNIVKMYGQENVLVMFEGNVHVTFQLHQYSVV